MVRSFVAVLLGATSHVAEAAQAQLPLRVGDCVAAMHKMEFFHKDVGEYEASVCINTNTKGTLLNVDATANQPSTVEWLSDGKKLCGTSKKPELPRHEPVVEGAVFLHQFARVPWVRAGIRDASTPGEDKCLTVVQNGDGFQPEVRFHKCAMDLEKGNTNADDKRILEDQRILQTFTYADEACDGRPIRWTHDPSKCLDAVHPTKVLLTDCTGVDSQRFLWKCRTGADGTRQCKLLTLGGRKDTCVTKRIKTAARSGGAPEVTDALMVRSCAEIHLEKDEKWEFQREFDFTTTTPRK